MLKLFLMEIPKQNFTIVNHSSNITEVEAYFFGDGWRLIIDGTITQIFVFNEPLEIRFEDCPHSGWLDAICYLITKNQDHITKRILRKAEIVDHVSTGDDKSYRYILTAYSSDL
jgi:hypothetical protein